MKVFSIGVYCLVINLTASWATIPPIMEETECNSAPPNLQNSCTKSSFDNGPQPHSPNNFDIHA